MKVKWKFKDSELELNEICSSENNNLNKLKVGNIVFVIEGDNLNRNNFIGKIKEIDVEDILLQEVIKIQNLQTLEHHECYNYEPEKRTLKLKFIRSRY